MIPYIPNRTRLEGAPCTDGPELWDTGTHSRDLTADNRLAIRLCQTECPAATREQCLAEAMKDESGLGVSGRWMVYGGLMPRERAMLEKKLGGAK